MMDQAATDEAASDPETAPLPPLPSPLYAWYVVGVLLLALAFAFIDRQIMSLLVVPIKRDLMLSDTQFSLLAGVAFAIFYATCGIPIARVGDRKSRRSIISIGVTVWCFMTAACGVVNNFWQLFVARMAVGVGEAALTPQAFSINSDNFPREKLPLAIGVYSMGIPIALGIAFVVGGVLVDYVATLPDQHIPFFGTIFNWQLSFFIVGLPGLLVAALIMLTVKEPARRGVGRRGGSGPAVQMPVSEVARFWLQNWKTFVSHHFGSALKGLLSSGTSMWMPAFFLRTYGWSMTQVGAWYGALTVIIAPMGMVTGGLIAGWLVRKGYGDANMRVVSYASVALIPFAILFPLMPGPYWALVFIVGRIFIGAVSIGPIGAALQVVSPNQIRGQISAIYLTISNLIGLGFGPTFIALLTDYLFRDEMMLRYSMSLTAVILGPLASALLFFGLRPYQESVERARAWTPAAA